MFDINKIRKDFPMLKNNPELIYFDSGATAFKPKVVIDTVNNYYTHINSNIHRGDYDISFMVSSEYENTRDVVKRFINANNTKEIVFTSGASNSLNLVAYGYGQKYLKEGDIVLSTEAEHASNILPWFKACEVTKAKVEYIKLNDDGTFNMDNYIKCFENKNIKIVTITHVSNVLGYAYPIKEICKIAHEHGAIVNVDGAQSVPHMKVDVNDLDVDFMSFSAHKLGGPDGAGVLYGKLPLLEKTDPFMLGGGSNARFDMCGNILLKSAPYKFESGTPNIEGVLGLKAAIEYINTIGIENIEWYESELQKYFIEKMKDLPNIEIYNPKASNCVVTFNVKGIFAQDVGTYLNKHHIAVRTGNHCAKILLNVIGASETIRASLYFYNTKEEIDRFIEVIKDITLEKCIGAVI